MSRSFYARRLPPWAVLMIGGTLGCSTHSGASTDLVDLPDGGASAIGPAAATATCSGDAASCLSGTATTSKLFQIAPSALVASLFRVFPSGKAEPIASQTVADDGTWAFGGLPAWAHYYVQLTANFAAGAAKPATVGSIVGPLALPSSGSRVAIEVRPVSIQVLESRPAGGALKVQWVSAHLFDPASGDELSGGAEVSIDVGGTTTPMPWTTDASGRPAYFLEFPAPPLAQASYTVKTVAKAFGSAPVRWNLTAAGPRFEGSIQTPATAGTLPAGRPLTVRWAGQPSADYENVELFFQQPTGWTSAWTSPAPDSPDTTQETIPGSALGVAGMYLLNVAFSSTSCPANADGCVYANAVAAAQLVVH